MDEVLVLMGSDWNAFSRHLHGLRKEATTATSLVEVPLYRPNRLGGEDMDMFGLSPAKDTLFLVVCLNCSKPIKTSRFANHFRQCSRRDTEAVAKHRDSAHGSFQIRKRKSTKDNHPGTIKRKRNGARLPAAQETVRIKKKPPPTARTSAQAIRNEVTTNGHLHKSRHGLLQKSHPVLDPAHDPKHPNGTRGRGRGKVADPMDFSKKRKEREKDKTKPHERDDGTYADNHPLQRLLQRAAISILAAPLASRTYTRRNRLGPITLLPHDTANLQTAVSGAVMAAGAGRAAISLSTNGNILGSMAPNGHPFAAINGFINAVHPSGVAPVGIPPNGLSLGKGPPVSHFVPSPLMVGHPTHSAPTFHQLPLTSLRTLPPNSSMMSIPHPILPGGSNKGAPLPAVSPPLQTTPAALVQAMRSFPQANVLATVQGVNSHQSQAHNDGAIPTPSSVSTAATPPSSNHGKSKNQRPTVKQRSAQNIPSASTVQSPQPIQATSTTPVPMTVSHPGSDADQPKGGQQLIDQSSETLFVGT